MDKGTYTATHSDLYWKVHTVYHIGDKHTKAKITFYYKSSNEVCLWLNPMGKAKNFKLLTNVVQHWVKYV